MVKTFERRGTSVPVVCPDCFSETFAMSEMKQIQRSAFLRKNSLNQLSAEFPLIVKRLSDFLLPVLLEQRIVPIHWHPVTMQGKNCYCSVPLAKMPEVSNGLFRKHKKSPCFTMCEKW